MNSINEQIFSAISAITDEKISKLKYDKTIQAVIYKVVNLDSGEYKVKYEGNIFSAFSDDLQKTFRVDDSVFVTIPEGDFSNRKVITSVVSARSLSYSQMTQLQNSIFPVSPTFDQLYKSTKGVLYDATRAWGVIAGKPLGQIGQYANIYEDSDLQYTAKYHGLFQQYARNYEYIRIRGSFLTQFHSSHTEGNYGIKVTFYAKNDGEVSYNLDFNSFNGSPYTFSTYAPQSVVIQTKKDYLLGLKSITLFEENFEYDYLIENGIETTENRTQPNIFVKDVYLDFVEVKDLSDSEYYLTIAAPQGMAFTDNVLSLDLTGRLLYRGDNILSQSSCQCQWFERDASIMIGHDKYNKDVGFGWASIDEKYTNFNTLNLSIDMVKHRQKYKLLVIYNETVKLTAEIEIFNNTSQYEFSLIQTTGTQSQLTNIWLELQKEKGPEIIYGNWYIAYPDGSYEDVDKGSQTSKIAIENYLIYSPVTFYCAVYTDSGLYLGTLEHTMTLMDSGEDVTIKYIGEDIYRYDANGDVAFEDSEKERILSVELTWKENTGASYYVTWIMKGQNGEEIEIPSRRQSAIFPPNSMIKEVWVDNYNILHYTIKQKYSVNNNNNLFIVKIRTAMDDIYLFEKEILFIKDGDQGTSGTTYIAAIRPCDTNGAKLSGVQPLVYNNGWIRSLPLRCYVYKDGNLINDSQTISIDYKWEGVNVNLNKETPDRVVVSGQDSIRPDGQYYVKTQVTIDDKTDNRKIDIYASYPIDVAVGGIDYQNVDISDIPSYIKYTASGINPQFYSNAIHFTYDGTDYTSEIISLTENVLQLEDKDNERFLRPAASYVFEQDTIAALRCQYTASQYLLHPIILYLNTYGNEAINGWDGTKLYIEKDKERFLFAPQIGAGEKDSANRFTGIVMGKYNVDDDRNQEMPIGLYGFKQGLNTFGLMDNGRAFFGAKHGGGQIIIDGRFAVIAGGDVGISNTGKITPAANGMYIQLADSTQGNGKDNEGASSNIVNSSTKAIGIGWNSVKQSNGIVRQEENFYVTYDGKLKATEADIQGTIYAVTGQIGGTAREGGWTIAQNRIFSGSGNQYVELNSAKPSGSSVSDNTYYAFWAGNNEAVRADFSVTKDGQITSTAGTIAGWKINKKSITSSNGKVGMSSDKAAFWAGSNLDENSNSIPEGSTGFLVTRNGTMYCKNANVSGTISADKGNIGGWIIKNGRLQTEDGGIYLSTAGIKMGDAFSVSSTGRLFCSDLDVTGGRISGTTIEGNTIKGGTIDGGTITGGSINIGSGLFRVDKDGTVFCRKVEQMEVVTSGGLNADFINLQGHGMIGYFSGRDASGNQTQVLGIQSYSNSIVLETPSNIALKSGQHVILQGSQVTINDTTLSLNNTTINQFNAAQNHNFIESIIAYAKNTGMITNSLGGGTTE